MSQYRKKPVIIEAHQWFKNGDHPEDALSPGSTNEGKIVRFYRHPSLDGQSVCSKCGRIMHDHGWIDTLEDGHNVCPGDWIIKGIQGEFYPCKPDIFAATYELVEAQPMTTDPKPLPGEVREPMPCPSCGRVSEYKAGEIFSKCDPPSDIPGLSIGCRAGGAPLYFCVKPIHPARLAAEGLTRPSSS